MDNNEIQNILPTEAHVGMVQRPTYHKKRHHSRNKQRGRLIRMKETSLQESVNWLMCTVLLKTCKRSWSSQIICNSGKVEHRRRQV